MDMRRAPTAARRALQVDIYKIVILMKSSLILLFYKSLQISSRLQSVLTVDCFLGATISLNIRYKRIHCN